MVPDLETARRLCEVGKEEATLLQSSRRPIVLLPRRSTDAVASAVAPRCNTPGIMLPYTPLHASLLKQYAESTGRGPTVLVMTSGNLSDEVVVEQLRPRADRILTHNRAIETRCDDSVPHVTAAGPQFLRRFYGYTPEPLSCL